MNMKKIAFEPEALEHLGEWATENKKVFKKIWFFRIYYGK
jgi:toxin YoeB